MSSVRRMGVGDPLAVFLWVVLVRLPAGRSRVPGQVRYLAFGRLLSFFAATWDYRTVFM